MQIHWIKIKKIVDETPEVKTYFLEIPEGYSWEEGSHLHLALEGFNVGEKPNKSLVRHMSISTLPNENAIGITTRIRQQCSEFKAILRNLQVGDQVAIFKTHSNVPLRRENKNIYLLSSGVGLATFRPIVLKYFEQPENVPQIHSLNIDSSKNYLFTNIFKTNHDKNFTAHFVDNREEYYDRIKKLSTDKNGLYYVVGSDDFLKQNIQLLLEEGIKPEQIMLDKPPRRLPDFLPIELSN